MKKLLSIILNVLFLTNCSDKSTNSASDLMAPDTVKYYYINDSIIIKSVNSEEDPYPDTAIFFSFPEQLFPIPGDKRMVNIYYDKAFKNIAVTMLLNKSDTSYHYKMFDRKGILRMEFFRKNGKIIGDEISWYSNGKYKNKWIYKDQNRIADTSYYWSGHLMKTSVYIKSILFKEYKYFRDGKVSSECVWEIPQNINSENHSLHEPRFLTEYDSASRLPKHFYLTYSEEVTTDKDGNEIMMSVITQIPVENAIIKTKRE